MEEMILLADENSYAWTFARNIQTYLQNEKNVKISLNKILIGEFRNKEIEMKVEENIRGKDVYYIANPQKSPNRWWVELLLVKDLVLNASANSLTLVLPDMYYSRQDRKDKSRVPISARALASSLSNGLKKIITMDLHAAQIQGFYPAKVPVDNLHSFPEVCRYLVKNYPEKLKNLLILSPDAGGVERVKAFMRKMEKLMDDEVRHDVGFMIKERPRAGEIGNVRYVGPEYQGKNVLIIDDIVDSGGTLCKSAETLKLGGAKEIFCYATHGLFTKGTYEIKSKFDKVFISNTHKQHNDDLEIVDVTPIFAEAIFRAQNNQSISELFR